MLQLVLFGLKIKSPLVPVKHHGQDLLWGLRWPVLRSSTFTVIMAKRIVLRSTNAWVCKSLHPSPKWMYWVYHPDNHVHGKDLYATCLTHWSEYCVDDMTLWPFTIQFKTWLDNWVLYWTTGQLQLKCSLILILITMIYSNSCLWMCYFCVGPQVARWSEIHKWNYHAMMGQFSCFSDEHSTFGC